MADSPAEFGPLFSHNITQHAKGIGRYSDGELVALLRTGVARDGKFSGPIMQSPLLADEDLLSIIAFLRSEDPWTAPQDVDDRNWQPTFLAKLLMHVAFKPMPVPSAPIVAPPVTDKVAYGRYLTTAIADCAGCHSASFMTYNPVQPEQSRGYLGGDNPTTNADGKIIRTANITMDKETGIAAWSEADFVRALHEGRRPDNRLVRMPMILFPDLSDADLSAIYAYFG